MAGNITADTLCYQLTNRAVVHLKYLKKCLISTIKG
jgi:hypothetical protein